MVEAVLSGSIVEDYSEQKRALLCGRTMLTPNVEIYLHVLCEYADPVTWNLLPPIFQTKTSGRVRRFGDEERKGNSYD